MERMLDLAAAGLGLERAKLRARNLIPGAKMPYERPMRERSGAPMVYDSGDYPATQAQALDIADWHGFPARQAEARAAGRYIGIGIANTVKGTGRGPFESGKVSVSASGQVSVFTGAVAMGQGLATALAQLTADELGIAPEQVRVTARDTAGSLLGPAASPAGNRDAGLFGISRLVLSRRLNAFASHLLEVSEIGFSCDVVRHRLVRQHLLAVGADAAGRRVGSGVSAGPLCDTNCH